MQFRHSVELEGVQGSRAPVVETVHRHKNRDSANVSLMPQSTLATCGVFPRGLYFTTGPPFTPQVFIDRCTPLELGAVNTFSRNVGKVGDNRGRGQNPTVVE